MAKGGKGGLLALVIILPIAALIAGILYPVALNQMTTGALTSASTTVSTVWTFVPVFFVLALVLGVIGYVVKTTGILGE